jgi:hypothetical protein
MGGKFELKKVMWRGKFELKKVMWRGKFVWETFNMASIDYY